MALTNTLRSYSSIPFIQYFFFLFFFSLSHKHAIFSLSYVLSYSSLYLSIYLFVSQTPSISILLSNLSHKDTHTFLSHSLSLSHSLFLSLSRSPARQMMPILAISSSNGEIVIVQQDRQSDFTDFQKNYLRSHARGRTRRALNRAPFIHYVSIRESDKIGADATEPLQFIETWKKMLLSIMLAKSGILKL